MLAQDGEHPWVLDHNSGASRRVGFNLEGLISGQEKLTFVPASADFEWSCACGLARDVSCAPCALVPSTCMRCCERESVSDLATPLIAVEGAGWHWACVGVSVSDTWHTCRMHFPSIGAAKRTLPHHSKMPSTLPLLRSHVSKCLFRANTTAVRAPDLGKPWGSFSRWSCGQSSVRRGETTHSCATC